MRRFLALPGLLLAALAVAAPAANATHFCNNQTTTVGILHVGGAALAYLVVDEILGPDGYLFSVGVYLESNGKYWLQRGGTTIFGVSDVCQDSLYPDTWWF